MPKTINIICLHNGTTNSDQDQYVSNVVKMRDGLVKDDSQLVFYADGIGNKQDWSTKTMRAISSATGYGGGWIMDEMFKQIKQELRQKIEKGELKAGDTLNFSVGGFSRGAATARHFGTQYLLKELPDFLAKTLAEEADPALKKANNSWTSKLFGSKKHKPKDTDPKINVALKAEYIFDTVPSFGIPINIWALEKLGIKNQEIDYGWKFDIPATTKAFHAVATDEVREGMTPRLVDYVNSGMTQEVFFAGTHSTVGGGIEPPKAGTPRMGDTDSLRWMAKSAHAEGLQFTSEFTKAHMPTQPPKELGYIEKADWKMLPPTQRGARELYVQEDGKKSNLFIVVHDSLMQRIQQDPNYRPEQILKQDGLTVLFENGNSHTLSADEFTSLKAFMTQAASIDSVSRRTRSKAPVAELALFSTLNELRSIYEPEHVDFENSSDGADVDVDDIDSFHSSQQSAPASRDIDHVAADAALTSSSSSGSDSDDESEDLDSRSFSSGSDSDSDLSSASSSGSSASRSDSSRAEEDESSYSSSESDSQVDSFEDDDEDAEEAKSNHSSQQPISQADPIEDSDAANDEDQKKKAAEPIAGTGQYDLDAVFSGPNATSVTLRELKEQQARDERERASRTSRVPAPVSGKPPQPRAAGGRP